jgi:hypothetical protein
MPNSLKSGAPRDRAWRTAIEQRPALPIRQFLNYFEKRDGEMRLKSSGRLPPKFLLETLAERFAGWWNEGRGGGSLDEAFGLAASGRGKKTPRERLAASERDYLLRGMYRWALGQEQRKLRQRGNKPSDRAIDALAGMFILSPETVRKIVRRKNMCDADES